MHTCIGTYVLKNCFRITQSLVVHLTASIYICICICQGLATNFAVGGATEMRNARPSWDLTEGRARFVRSMRTFVGDSARVWRRRRGNASTALVDLCLWACLVLPTDTFEQKEKTLWFSVFSISRRASRNGVTHKSATVARELLFGPVLHLGDLRCGLHIVPIPGSCGKAPRRARPARIARISLRLDTRVAISNCSECASVTVGCQLKTRGSCSNAMRVALRLGTLLPQGQSLRDVFPRSGATNWAGGLPRTWLVSSPSAASCKACTWPSQSDALHNRFAGLFALWVSTWSSNTDGNNRVDDRLRAFREISWIRCFATAEIGGALVMGSALSARRDGADGEVRAIADERRPVGASATRPHDRHEFARRKVRSGAPSTAVAFCAHTGRVIRSLLSRILSELHRPTKL